MNDPAALEACFEGVLQAFLARNYERAVELAAPVVAVPYAGNGELWTWVALTLALRWRIARERGEDVSPFLMALQSPVYATESKQRIAERALARRRSGSLLAEPLRVHHIAELCFMQAHGGSDTWPDERIEHALAELRP